MLQLNLLSLRQWWQKLVGWKLLLNQSLEQSLNLLHVKSLGQSQKNLEQAQVQELNESLKNSLDHEQKKALEQAQVLAL